jgi:RHS repeat-associated protein
VAPEHGYLSERQDPATGLVYLRARWYDPQTGRFLTPDLAKAVTDDSRSLHRYVYSSDDPLNKYDPSGETNLASTMASISIQSVLTTIRTVIVRCIGQKVSKKLIKAVATFVVNHILDFAMDAFEKAIYSVLPVPGADKVLGGEGKFQQFLAEILCTAFGIFGTIDFEVKLDNCGDLIGGVHLDCNTKDLKGRPMQSYPGSWGVDIIVANAIPIELKWSKGSGGGPQQLEQRCRFAHKRRTFLALYVYFNPKGFDHDKYALRCWNCWDGAESCSGRLAFGGSIYVAASVQRMDDGQRIYIPDPKGLCY